VIFTGYTLSGHKLCAGAVVDNAWEQETLEARKMLENAAESLTSGALSRLFRDALLARFLPTELMAF